jgi:MoaA/NifB/PqqE/SkfB family radical SAM enzyme
MTGYVDILRARPDSVCIEITNKCNLRCSYCSKSDDRLEAEPWNNIDMSDDAVAALYRYCKDAGIRNVSLSGVGETAMVAGWHGRIAAFLDDPEIDVHLVSNFIRVLDDDDLNALTKLRNLQISFDSADLAMVRRLRSRADLRTIAYNIVRLRQKMKELGRRPNVDVNCTLSRINIGELARLAGFCRELGVDRLIVGEVMTTSANNSKMPEKLDRLTDAEIILLARQIIAAENELRESDTSLNLQDHLRARIEEIVEQLREGGMPADPAGYFHRRMASSACRQPWTAPFVRANGDVYACCSAIIGGEPLGSLATSSMQGILDSASSRAVRAEILNGRTSLPCDGCTLARSEGFEEFAHEIREWQGESGAVAYRQDIDHAVWRGLLGRQDHPIIVENGSLNAADETIKLIEGRQKGLHRILFNIDQPTVSALSFAARPAGRRRLRLDLGNDVGGVLARVHIVLTAAPRVEVAIGSPVCITTPGKDRWYQVEARFHTPILLSNINLTLMREDNGVIYAGDARSGLELSNFRLG